MGGENINNSGENTSDERAEWQSLGHKIAEQIASHTTTDVNNETLYVGRELSEKARGKVEEAGFEKSAEQPRGTSRDGTIAGDVYPKQPGESNWELRKRMQEMQRKTDAATVKQIRQKAKQILTDDAVNDVYDRLLDQGIIRDGDPSDKKRNLVVNEARELSLKTINHYYEKMLPNNNKHELYVSEAYEKLYTDKIIDDNSDLQITKKELEGAAIDQAILDARQDESNRRWYYEEKKPSWEYQNGSAEVANGVLKEYTHDIFSGLFDDYLELPKDEVEKRQRAVIKTAIRSGLFMPNTTVENPEKADTVLVDNGIDKNSAQITAFAVDGIKEVDDDRKKEIASYFDLNNKINTMMDNPDFTFRYKKGDQDELRVKYDVPYYKRKLELDEWTNERILDPEVTHVALDRLKNAASQIEESINNNSEYVEKKKDNYRQFTEDFMANSVLNAQRSFDFEYLLRRLDVTKIDYGDTIIKHFISERDDPESFSRLLFEYMDTNRPNSPLEIDVDYRKAIRDGLKMRLEQGVAQNGNRNIDLTQIFETQEYIDNEAKIGLDFTDETIARLAFTGFLNTIKTRNGEYSDEANWYYDNIFSNDPEYFESMIMAFKGNSNDLGTNRKLTNFGSERSKSDYWAYLQSKERDKSLEKDNQRVIKRAQITNLTRTDLEDLRDQYAVYIYNQFLQKNPASLQPKKTNKNKGSIHNLPNNNNHINQEDIPPFDFGLQKIDTLIKYYDFIDNNIPDSNVKAFQLVFGNKKVGINNPDRYMGFAFNYEGNRCAIADSLSHKGAAMYLIMKEGGALDSSDPILSNNNVEPFLQEAFKDAKTSALTLPLVTRVIHRDRDNFDKSLDESYQESFMFFRTRNKKNANWRQMRASQFPAWPILFDNGAQMDDLARYQEWQDQQMQNQDELVDEKLRMWNRTR